VTVVGAEDARVGNQVAIHLAHPLEGGEGRERRPWLRALGPVAPDEGLGGVAGHAPRVDRVAIGALDLLVARVAPDELLVARRGLVEPAGALVRVADRVEGLDAGRRVGKL